MRRVQRRRQFSAVLVALLGMTAVLAFAWDARAQTTSSSSGVTTTTRAATTTTRAVTTTRPVATTTTTTKPSPPPALAFQATPTEGPIGSTIQLQSINQCRGTGSFFVLASIGQFRLGSGPADNVGNWKLSVTVPQIPTGTYRLTATCLISRNGVDENAGIYTGPLFNATPGQGPPEPTTPAAEKSESSDNTALVIGLIVAVVVAIAAIVWALVLRNKHKKAQAAASASDGTFSGQGDGGPPPV
jgi:hypothetical protein